MSARGRVGLGYAAILTLLTVYGAIADSALTWLYLGITIALTAVMIAIDRSARFSLGVLAALATVAVGNMAGGVLVVDGATLYLSEVIGPLRYDKLFHAYATGVGAVASWRALQNWADVRIMTPGLAAAAFLMACGAGALVEIVEYVGTLIVPNANVGDYGNNMLDLVANSAGAVGGVMAGWWWGRRGGR